MLILSIILLPFTKKSLWQWCSGAQIELQKEPYKNKSYIIILLVVIITLMSFPFFHKNAAFPISIPEKAYYVKNIRQHKEEPINYVMQLFDKYDIVILCERVHPECTQWEFFSEIIMNDTFVSNVKNVFTEVGNTAEQERLDSYMNTHFSTEEDLQCATATIARECAVWPIWTNTNIYDFIFRLHQYNETRDSLNRINLFFTDSTIDWNTVKNPIEYDSILIHCNRDSIMAYNVINRYESQHLNKCLIITNTRHAWKYGKNQAAYIFEKFPNKMAVVWINSTSQFLSPAMNGTLDAASLEIQDSIWAIDFENCPLGNTLFDLMPFKRDKCTYKDLFVGMIYCKHPNSWKLSENYPFILDNFKDTLLKRSTLLENDYVKRQNDLIEKRYYDTINSRKSPFFVLTNLLFLSIHSVILLFLFLNLFIKLLSLLFRKNRVDAQ